MVAARKTHNRPSGKTVNAEEVSAFSALADTWWDAHGPMEPLHRMNPVRLDYIKSRITAHFAKKKTAPRNLVDIGCAAGLISEPLAAWGTSQNLNVTGIDASENLVEAARTHSKEKNIVVDYRVADVDALAEAKETFDIVLALEVLEHVDEQAHFISQAAKLLAKDGLMIVSTLNRSVKGFALGIVGAEYLLRWLPRGTHDWRKFVKPSELSGFLDDAGLNTDSIVGLRFNPLTGCFSISPQDVDVNYIVCASR